MAMWFCCYESLSLKINILLKIILPLYPTHCPLPNSGAFSLNEVIAHSAKFPKVQWQGNKAVEPRRKEERYLIPGRIVV